ncbi:MAG: ATP synthase F1 subunit delta [Candidatus Omnitrophica bacterium]|nr:ATP synthase F1 subunit delta [Candidatus Omnitrophota bacterium]
MKTLEIADRYTRSAFELANEKGAVEILFQELATVREAMESRSELLNLLQSPLITQEEKRSLIEGILGPKASALAREFLNVLVEKKRIDLFPFIVDRLRSAIYEKKGIQEATVVAARELHPSIIQLIQKALERATQKKVELQTEVDKRLLGGLQIRMGNHLIDGSLRTKLDTLKSQLIHAKV